MKTVLRRSVLLFILLILAGFSVMAQTPAPVAPNDEPVVKIGPGVTPPRVTKQLAPEAPHKGFRISGAVLISIVVNSKGEPKEPRVVKSLEKDIDQSAINAVLQWQFAPAMQDGKPVATRVTVEIRFHDM